MKKMKLDVASLRVDSFAIPADVAARGTIHGHGVSDYCTAVANCTTRPGTVDCTRAAGCAISFPTICGCDTDTDTIPDPNTNNPTTKIVW